MLLSAPGAPRAARAVACAYFVCHLAAISNASLFRPSALGAARAFDAYTRFFGLWQTWDMFTTIPYYLDLDGQLVARDTAGRETRHGAMLPGLARYRKDLRVHGLFLRLLSSPTFGEPGRRYIWAACRAIEARTERPVETVRIELVGARIRRLDDIRRDGRLYETDRNQSADQPCVP